MFSSAIERFNEKRRNTGEVGEDAGFTLIELMVVLLILAILLAIAIPTFLGVTKSANDRAAQSNLNTALLNAKAQYQQNSQSYPTAANLVTALQSAEPSLQFLTTNSADQNHISVWTSGDGNALILAVYSAQTKNCWMVVDVPSQVTPVANTPITGTAQAPVTAANAELNPVAATTPVTFPDNQLGPTYVEMKTESGGTVTPAACSASAPSAIAGTAYMYSYTAFPAAT
jgi:type IV pilus assembly protein PilA